VGSAAGCRHGGARPCCCLVGSHTRTYQSVRDGLVGVHRVRGRLRPAGASRGHDTRRLRQALTIVDPAVLPDATAAGGRRKELAVGPVKSTASNAILTLPSFAVQALRAHRRQQLRLRLACGQPATVGLRFIEPGRPPRPVQLDLVFRTERGTPVNRNHASRAFARLAASVGLTAHRYLLRHALVARR